MLTRRTLIVAGGSLIGVTSLGGCSDDDGSDGDGGDDGSDADDAPPSDDGSAVDGGDDTSDTDDGSTDGDDDGTAYTFGVEEFVYTTKRVRTLGEYTPQPNTTYRDGEMIWVYIEVSNVPKETTGPHLDTEWTFRGPDGEEILATEESVRIPEETLEERPNEAFLTQGVDTSYFETPRSGEYTLDVTVTELETGERVDLSRTVRIRKFEFAAVALAADQPTGFDEYTPQPDATYDRGDDVWVYLEVINPPLDDTGAASLSYTLDVEQPDGSMWDPVEGGRRFEDVQMDDILAFWEGIQTAEDDPVGEYELTITVESRARGESIQTVESFTLE